MGARGPAGVGAVGVAKPLTGTDGTATWVFPAPLSATPTVSAVAVTTSTAATLVQLVSVTATQVVVKALRQNATSHQFVPIAGVRLHLAAFL